MRLLAFSLYSQNPNHRGTVALVAQGVLGALAVPWDLVAPPARSAPVCLSFLLRPERPEGEETWRFIRNEASQ